MRSRWGLSMRDKKGGDWEYMTGEGVPIMLICDLDRDETTIIKRDGVIFEQELLRNFARRLIQQKREYIIECQRKQIMLGEEK